MLYSAVQLLMPADAAVDRLLANKIEDAWALIRVKVCLWCLCVGVFPRLLLVPPEFFVRRHLSDVHRIRQVRLYNTHIVLPVRCAINGVSTASLKCANHAFLSLLFV